MYTFKYTKSFILIGRPDRLGVNEVERMRFRIFYKNILKKKIIIQDVHDLQIIIQDKLS